MNDADEEHTPPQDRQPSFESSLKIGMAAFRELTLSRVLCSILEELFPMFSSVERFQQCMQNLYIEFQQEPCTTVFQFLIGIFGILPLCGFVMFSIAAFMITCVCSFFWLSTVIICALLVCTSFYMFLILFCGMISFVITVISQKLSSHVWGVKAELAD